MRYVMKRVSWILILWLVLQGMDCFVFGGGEPLGPDSVMFQAFYKDVPEGGVWYDTIRGEAGDLKAAGFTHFWFPPPTKGASGGYSMGYDLYDNYDLGNYDQKGTVETRFGSLAELQAAAAACENVILDLVANHMMGAEKQSRDPVDGNWYWQGFEYVHDRFWKSAMDFHPGHPDGGDLPEGGDYILGEDVCHNSQYMVDGQLEWARWMKETVGNVSGFRLDAAKHFSWNMSKALGGVADCIGEFWDGKDRISQWTGYTGNYAYDFPLYYALQDNAAELDGAGLGSRGITFVANHDTDDVWQKYRAYGFIMYITPIPCVFWHDWFNGDLQPAIRRALSARKRYDFKGTRTVYKNNDLIMFANNGGVYGCFNSNPFDAYGTIQASPHTRYTAIAWGPGDKPRDVRSDGFGNVTLNAPAGGYCYWIRSSEHYRSAYLTVHVPGDNEGVFGNRWYFGPSNEMELVSDYTWRWVRNVGGAASIEYKFAMDGSWDANRGLGQTSGSSLPQENRDLAGFGANIGADLPGGICVWQYREDRETSRLFTVDFDHDGEVDVADLAIVARYWEKTDCAGSAWCGGTDLNKDGSVGTDDLAEFIGYWLFGDGGISPARAIATDD